MFDFDWGHLFAGVLGSVGGVIGMVIGKRTRSADADADRFVQLKNEIIQELREENRQLKDEVKKLQADHARVVRHDVAFRIVITELMRIQPQNMALKHAEALLGDEFDGVVGNVPGTAELLHEIDRVTNEEGDEG